MGGEPRPAQRRKGIERRAKDGRKSKIDLEKHVDLAKMIDEGPDEELQLIPPIFYKVDQVQDYGFKQTPYFAYKEAFGDEAGAKKRKRVLRVARTNKRTMLLKWGDPIPQENAAAASASAFMKEAMDCLTPVFNCLTPVFV